MSTSLQLGDLSFEVRWSPRRKSVGITVERDGGLTLSLPEGFPLSKAERAAERKRFWVYRKLAEKAMLFTQPNPKEYVSGEGFLYLGRSYRLKLTSENGPKPLSLREGRFLLQRAERQRAAEHFTRWYIQHGQPWLQRRVSQMADRVGVEIGRVKVRDLGYRWGSCSANGNIHFHWRTVLLPPRIIEYVVAHELIHLHERLHTPEFWRRLERVVPDYRPRRQWLAENGGRL